ncbi:NmrA family NAD(P)-binding protein [Arthrobacter sp. SA17]
MTRNTFLITGASGKTGRRVSRLLQEQGHAVREASRSSQTPFDWNDQATWPAALDGVFAVYVVLPDLGSPGTVEQVRSFAELAAASGVKKAVMVSFPEDGGMDFSLVSATERQITDAGLALTVLRLRWFSQNFSEDFLTDPVRSGDLRLSAGDGQEAFVDADDIAEVAVAALTDGRHDGRSYELTGPRTLSFTEIAEELSGATGRNISYTAITVEEFIAEQTAQGVPAEWAQMLGYMYSHIGSGALASTSGDVEKVLNRPSRDFSAYARATAATGVWNI